eukprot:6040146-Prorocentrum_lima.AAC.1
MMNLFLFTGSLTQGSLLDRSFIGIHSREDSLQSQSTFGVRFALIGEATEAEWQDCRKLLRGRG